MNLVPQHYHRVNHDIEANTIQSLYRNLHCYPTPSQVKPCIHCASPTHLSLVVYSQQRGWNHRPSVAISLFIQFLFFHLFSSGLSQVKEDTQHSATSCPHSQRMWRSAPLPTRQPKIWKSKQTMQGKFTRKSHFLNSSIELSYCLLV